MWTVYQIARQQVWQDIKAMKPHVARLHGGGVDSDVTKALGFVAALSGDDASGNEEGSELQDGEHCCCVLTWFQVERKTRGVRGIVHPSQALLYLFETHAIRSEPGVKGLPGTQLVQSMLSRKKEMVLSRFRIDQNCRCLVFQWILGERF
jgi:hypothetical protein